VGRQSESEADFRSWVSASRSRLRTTAYLLCGDWFLADDLVQDALARLFSVWDRVVAGGDPTAYARRVLVNLSLDHWRRPARREVPHAELPDSGRVVAVGGEDRERLIAALRRVPPGQRAVLVLRFWEDLSIEQTAQALGTSAGNVKSQTSRGLDALRAALGAGPVTSPRE
jgi:RNA polymerase sigma-70 factor (sigma-E family)